MNEKESAYELHFSFLGTLQAAKAYRYTLNHCGAENRYCLSISEWENEILKKECKKQVSMDDTQACNVVQWLYQNAVAPVHLDDVLRDLKVQGILAMQE